MTVKDFASAASGSVMIEIQESGEKKCVFDSEYWECEAEAVLELEVESFTAESVSAKRPYVIITVAGEDETEPDDDNPDGNEPDGDDPNSGDDNPDDGGDSDPDNDSPDDGPDDTGDNGGNEDGDDDKAG